MTCTELPLVEGPAVVIGRKGNVGEARYFATGCWPIDTTYYVVVPEGIDPEPGSTGADFRVGCWRAWRV